MTPTAPIELRLLVVDDAQEEASLYGWYLTKVKRFKVDIDFAENGKKGLEKLDSGTYDLVFTDYRMPVMDGLVFLAEMRKRATGIPIVFLTGAGDEVVAANAIKLGAMEYLHKRDLPRTDFGLLLDRALFSKKKVVEAEEKQDPGELRERLIAELSRELQATQDALQAVVQKNSKSVDPSDKSLAGAVMHLEVLLEDLNNLRGVIGSAEYKPKILILRTLLSSALERKRPVLEAKGILVVADLPEREIRMSVDPNALQVVLENLVSSAAHFSPEQGTLTIRAERFSSGLLRLGFHNKGNGHPIGALARMTDAAAAAPPAQDLPGGFGLSLRICRRILESHRGQLWIENDDQGATAYLTLPTTLKK